MRRISSWEDRHRVFYGLRDPVVKISFFVLLPVAAVVLFLVLRGPDRPAFAFGPSIARSEVGSGAVVAGVPSWWGGSPPAVAREADRIAASNPTVAQLVRLGDGERFGNVGGSRARGSGTAWLGYKLSAPSRSTRICPMSLFLPMGLLTEPCVFPYAAGWAHLRATGVTALWVIVDLRRDEVVQISTNARRRPSQPRRRKALPNLQRGPDRLRVPSERDGDRTTASAEGVSLRRGIARLRRVPTRRSHLKSAALIHRA